MNKLSHLTRTSFLLAAFFLLDKVIAFGRSILIARQFSLSSDLDAFNVANNLPDLLFALISGGAIAMAFIPLLTETLASNGRAAAWELFSRVANFAFLVTLVFAIVVAAFAEQIVKAQIGIAPGFSAEQQQLVARLMQLNLVGTILFSISGLVMASLQANQHFLLPAIAPTLYNVGMIFGALVLSPSQPYVVGEIALPAFGFGVYGLVYGVILGAMLHLGIQIPGMIKFGFRWTPSLDLRDSGLVQALKLIAPRLLTMFGIQLIFILRDNFASRLGQVGGVSALTYGWMIMQVPETIIGTAIATALLPTLSEYVAKKEWDKFNEAISKGLSVMISLSLPIAGILALYIKPLVGAAFGFDEAGTALLATTTQIYMLTLVGYVVQETLARAFYARLEPKIPLMGVGVRLVLYVAIVGIGFTYFQAVGAPVIAAGELAVLAEAGFLFLLLSKRSGLVIRVRSSFLRGGAALVVVGLLWVVVGWVSPAGSLVVSLLAMVVSGLAALAIVWKDASSVLRL
jgi:putative peptidoglycan lipid II flippase